MVMCGAPYSSSHSGLSGAPLQSAAILPVSEARTHSLTIRPFGKAQPVQDANRVRRHIDAAADLV